MIFTLLLLAAGSAQAEGFGPAGELERAVLVCRLAREGRPSEAKAGEPRWCPPYVTEDGIVTLEGMRLLEAAASPSVRRFGGPGGGSGPGKTIEALASGAGDAMLEERMERLFDGRGAADADGESGFVLELGRLGGGALLGESPFVNVSRTWESDPGSSLDTRVEGQVGFVDLHARLFRQEEDPRAERLLDLAESLGVDQERLAGLRRFAEVSAPLESHGIVTASVLSQAGRAYSLVGPFDVSWTAGNLTKLAFIAPNTAFDETLGLRLRLPGRGLSLGLFAGATQNIGLAGGRLLEEALSLEGLEAGPVLETAERATLAVWGGLSRELSFSLTGARQRTRDTAASEAGLSIVGEARGRPLFLSCSWRREQGSCAELYRTKTEVELACGLSRRCSAFVGYSRDRIGFGGASVDDESVVAGVEFQLGRSVRVSLDEVLAERLSAESPLRPRFQELLDRVNSGVAKGLDVAD
ncbi:MAG: hypothetical protein WC943_13675, partial [Elusimicrobiota bacterium]